VGIAYGCIDSYMVQTSVQNNNKNIEKNCLLNTMNKTRSPMKRKTVNKVKKHGTMKSVTNRNPSRILSRMDRLKSKEKKRNRQDKTKKYIVSFSNRPRGS
jgi:hypothetical protein